MGLFWDLIQQSQISQQRNASDSLEARVRDLESQIREVTRIQLKLLQKLEAHFGHDIDGDGRVS